MVHISPRQFRPIPTRLWVSCGCCPCVRIDSDPDATRKHLGPAGRHYPDRGTSSCPGTLTPASTPNDVDLDCWVEWSSMAPRPPLRSQTLRACEGPVRAGDSAGCGFESHGAHITAAQSADQSPAARPSTALVTSLAVWSSSSPSPEARSNHLEHSHG